MSKRIIAQDGNITIEAVAGDLLSDTPLFIAEQAAASTSNAAYGQLWVRNDSPNVLVFTDDDGTDFVVGDATSADTGFRIIGDINTATPPTTETINAVIDFYDNDETDLIGRIGMEGSQTFNIDAIMRGGGSGGTLRFRADSGGGTLRTMFEASGDGNTDVTGNDAVRLRNVNGDTLAQFGAGGGITLYDSTGTFYEKLRSTNNTTNISEIYQKLPVNSDTWFNLFRFAWQNNTSRGYVGHTSTGNFNMVNEVHGANVYIGGENAGGTSVQGINLQTDEQRLTLGPNLIFDISQTVGAGVDGYVLTYDNGTGLVSLEAVTSVEAGTTNDSMLRWEDSQWREETSIRGSTSGSLSLEEKAEADTNAAGFGQFWVENLTPAYPRYTDDAGGDYWMAVVGGTPAQNAIATFSNGTTAGGLLVAETGFTYDATGNGQLDLRNGAQFTIFASGNADQMYIQETGTVARFESTDNPFQFTAQSDFTPAGHQFQIALNDVKVLNGAAFLIEETSAGDGEANFGNIWVRDDTPNTLMFRDDAGNDFILAGSGQGSAGSLQATVQTTDATQTEIIAIGVASGQTFGYRINIVGTEDSTGDTVFESIFGAIRNQAGTTAIVGSDIVDRTDDSGATAWTITVAADDTTDELTVDVTGEAAHTIDWKVNVELLGV